MNQLVRLTMDAFRPGFGACVSESAFPGHNNCVIDINCLVLNLFEARHGGSLKDNLLGLFSEMQGAHAQGAHAFACLAHACYIEETGGFCFSRKSEYQNVRGGGIP